MQDLSFRGSLFRASRHPGDGAVHRPVLERGARSRSRMRPEQEPDAPSRQGLGAQLPRFGGAPAGAGGRGRADGAGGGAAVWRS